ncbi:MAG: hypothetical protein R2741_07895 [Methanolobus sp.]
MKKTTRGIDKCGGHDEIHNPDDVCGYSLQKWRRHVKIRKSNVFEVYVTDKEIREAYESYPMI